MKEQAMTFDEICDTYGEPKETHFPQHADPAHLWTLVDTDDGAVLVSGYHYVNALSWSITEKPVAEGDSIWEVDDN